MGRTKVPYIANVDPYIKAGIDLNTGLPNKFTSTLDCALKDNIKKIIRVVDEQDAVNKGTWYNLPVNMSSQDLERLLYYKYSLIFFYYKELDEFYFMPYALDGGLDFYNRYKTVHPIPLNDDKTKKALLSTKKLNVVYAPVIDMDEEDFYNSCVILQDYTPQFSENGISRQQLNEPLIDLESTCLPYLKTNLSTSSGVRGVRVSDADTASDVIEGGKSIDACAVAGVPFVPIVGGIDFQELPNGAVSKTNDYLLAMQSIDNLRLSTHGLQNGGLFEKQGTILQSESDMNSAMSNLVLDDCVKRRQNFCNICNSIWGTSMWYEPNEKAEMQDRNLDGRLGEENNGEQSGVSQKEDDNAEME